MRTIPTNKTKLIAILLLVVAVLNSASCFADGQKIYYQAKNARSIPEPLSQEPVDPDREVKTAQLFSLSNGMFQRDLDLRYLYHLYGNKLSGNKAFDGMFSAMVNSSLYCGEHYPAEKPYKEEDYSRTWSYIKLEFGSKPTETEFISVFAIWRAKCDTLANVYLDYRKLFFLLASTTNDLNVLQSGSKVQSKDRKKVVLACQCLNDEIDQQKEQIQKERASLVNISGEDVVANLDTALQAEVQAKKVPVSMSKAGRLECSP